VRELPKTDWLGYAAVERSGRLLWRPGATARLRLRGRPPPGLTVRLDGAEVATGSMRRRGALYFFDLKLPVRLPESGRLSVSARGHRPRTWSVRVAPEVLVPPEAEIARAHARAGRAEAAVEAWAAAAAASTVASVRRRCLRAAAWHATNAGAFRRAYALLGEAAGGAEGDPVGEARLRWSRALLAHGMGDARTSLSELDAARTLAFELEDDAFVRGLDEMRALRLADLGRFSEALALLGGARPYATRSDAASVDRARYFSNLGFVTLQAMAAGAVTVDWAAPVAHIERALHLAGPDGAVPLRANRYANLGWAHRLAGRPISARAALAKARALDPKWKHLARHFVALQLAALDIDAGDLVAARVGLEAVLARVQIETAGAPSDAEWRARYGLGRAAESPAAAVGHFRAALSVLEATGRATPLLGGRVAYHADRRMLRADTVAALLALGRVSEAFSVADAARARILRTLEATTALGALDGVGREAWATRVETWRSARVRLDSLQDAGPVPDSDRARRAEALSSARSEVRRSFTEALEALDAMIGPVVGAASGEAVARVLRAGEALLAVGERRCPTGLCPVRFLVRRSGVRVVDDLPLEGVSRLYVVAGAAEIRPPGVAVGHLPYAGLLVRPHAPGHGAPLVVADPRLDLPHARREGDRVPRGPGGRILSGAQATRAAVLEGWKGAPLFHFAGHGVLRADDPWAAHLLVADGGRIDLGDVLIRGGPAGLVVLSGCRTGAVSTRLRGDVVGLPEAFVAAGARAVLAADSDVDDAATARFIERFYAAGGLRDPASALRIASEGHPEAAAWRLVVSGP